MKQIKNKEVEERTQCSDQSNSFFGRSDLEKNKFRKTKQKTNK